MGNLHNSMVLVLSYLGCMPKRDILKKVFYFMECYNNSCKISYKMLVMFAEVLLLNGEIIPKH